MGFRFLKSKSFGPLKVNLSKRGLGWSIGGKGFRHTKKADGKTQNTYSIPGTGISYVNVDSDHSHTDSNSSFNGTSNDNPHIKISNGNGNKKPPKLLLIILAALLYFFSWASFPKSIGALTLLGGLGLGYYLFAKSLVFKHRHVLIKILTSIFIVCFMLIFGLGGLFLDTSSTTNNKVAQNSTKVDDKVALDDTSKKADEEEKLKAEQEAQQKAQQEAKLKAEQEAKQKSEKEAKLKAEQEAQQKAQDDQAAKEKAQAEQKAKSEQATQSTPQPKSPQGSSSSSSGSSGQGLIKGNINSKGEKIYHVPGSTYYDRTNPERWFNTVEEAQAAGFRAPKK
jgi:hypothetical protein